MPNEIDAMRELAKSNVPMYGFMPVTPGQADIEANKDLEVYRNAGDIVSLSVSKETNFSGRLEDEAHIPLLDSRSKAAIRSYLEIREDRGLEAVMSAPAEKQYGELMKLYNSDPGTYGPGGAIDLRRILMRTQFIRDWELYMKLMSGKEGALGKAEREHMFECMRRSAETKYRDNPERLKQLYGLINKVEADTEKYLAKGGPGMLVLMKSEWSDLINGMRIKDAALRRAFYDLAIEATKEAKWTAGKQRESIMDRDGVKKFFDEINKNAPEEVRKSNLTAQKRLNEVMDKYDKEKDEDGLGQKTFAVLCSTIAIDRAANAFSLGITVSDGDRIVYMNTCVSPEHGADVKCAEIDSQGEFVNYVEQTADIDYSQDVEEERDYAEQEAEEMEQAQEPESESEQEPEPEEEEDIIYDLFGER